MKGRKFQVEQRVKVKTSTDFGLIETEGEIVKAYGRTIYRVAVDDVTYEAPTNGMLFNESELEAI